MLTRYHFNFVLLWIFIATHITLVHSIKLRKEKKISRAKLICCLLAKRVTPIIIYGNYKASLLLYFNVILWGAKAKGA